MSAKVPGSETVVQISYCPDLRMYHYVRSDGDEFFFDDGKLAATLSIHLSQKNERYAEYMAVMTAEARNHPHKILVYEGEKPYRIVDPVPYSFVAGADVPGCKPGKKG